jgi:tetratricopeptide (TPR) repeat protein
MNRRQSVASNTYSDEENTNRTYDYSENTSAQQQDNIYRNQNIRLVWLHSNNYKGNYKDDLRTIEQLRQRYNTLDIFTNTNRCTDFVMTITNGRIFMIIPNELAHDILSILHDIDLLDSVFIFDDKKAKHEQSIEKWPKVKGIFEEAVTLCNAVKEAAEQREQGANQWKQNSKQWEQDVEQCEQQTPPTSFVSTSGNASHQGLNQLDPLYMYTKIFKEILLAINFKEQQIQEFTDYCRQKFVDDDFKLVRVEKFNQDYSGKKAIWWYTYEPFLHEMLNHALRIMDVDVIMKMGFFVCDLHRHIEDEHKKQSRARYSTQPLVVYRGQGASKVYFDQIVKTKGGLMAFNSFLSTSEDQEVSRAYAESNSTNSNLIGILFVMTIDPSKSTTPFADIKEISYYKDEDEILFSMHTIFRICEIKQLNETKRFYQVNLTLTRDDDKDLYALTQRMREETFPDSNGWERLGLLLLKIGRPEKAEQVYEVSLKYTRNDARKPVLYNQIGCAMESQGKDTEAIIYFEESLAVMEKTLPPYHPRLASTNNNIANLYNKNGQHSKALPYYEKGLIIQQKISLQRILI